jgi:hypothetical protein
MMYKGSGVRGWIQRALEKQGHWPGVEYLKYMYYNYRQVRTPNHKEDPITPLLVSSLWFLFQFCVIIINKSGVVHGSQRSAYLDPTLSPTPLACARLVNGQPLWLPLPSLECGLMH